MSELLTEIPACPESIKTPDARELFMDLCSEAIQDKRLTETLLECITGYSFITQISRFAEEQIMKHEDFEWHSVWTTCVNRELEYSEIIGLTPLDRKKLGLV